MASVDYPCRLPGVLVNSNGYSSKNRVRRNSLESGPPIYVLEDDDGYEMFDVTWSFDALEVQVFRNWYRWLITSGSRLFNIDLMVDGWDGEKQTKTLECYFDGVPSYTQNGRRWMVSTTLLAIKEQTLDECDGITLVSAYSAFDYGGASGGLNAAFSDVDEATNSLISAWDTTPSTPPGITCTSNYYESGYWQGAGLGTGASWSGSVWEKGSFNPAIILDEDGTFGNWVAGYTPTTMYITASDSESRTFTVSLLDQSLVEIITSSPTINLTPTPQSFEFTLDFTGLSDIENLSMATTGPNTGSIIISCIQFEPE